jgi:transposase
VEALRRHPAPGPQPKLSAGHLAQRPTLVERGAEAYGFRGQVWTCRRVAAVIQRPFGVTYHPAHVSRLLHALRQRVQRPRSRAAQRDEAALSAWWRERWPALEKKPPTKAGPSSG